MFAEILRFKYYYYYYIISGLNMWQTIGYVESLERIKHDENTPEIKRKQE